MIFKSYTINGIFIISIISGILTTIFSLLGNNYYYLIILIANFTIAYSHMPKRIQKYNNT